MLGCRCSPCFPTAPVSWLRVTNTPQQQKQDSSSLRVPCPCIFIYLFIYLPFDPTNNKFDCNLCRLTSCSLSINLWFEASGTPRRFLVVCKAPGRSRSLIMGGKWKYRRQLYPCVAPTSACRELLISVRVALRLPLKYLKCREGRFREKKKSMRRVASRGLKPRADHGRGFLFKGKVPGAPASWKYHTD